jgi:hypothetical protein
MRRAALAAFLGLIASLGEAKQHSTFRVHAEANPKNGPAFSTQVRFFGRLVTMLKKDWPRRK